MKSPVRKTTALLRTARRQADLPRARHVLLPPTRLRLVGGLVLAGALPPLLSLAIGHTHLGLAGITFLGVVLLSALLARLAGGLVAAVSGALAYLDWFGPPSGELSVTRTTDAIAVAVFVGVALLVSLITGLQQAARAGLERHARALEEAVDGLRALLDGLGAVVWMSDERFRVTFISQSVERILGYTRERWLDEVDFWLAHIHPDDRERVSAETRAHAQAGEDYEHDYRFVAADGRVVWLRNIVSVSRTSRGRPSCAGSPST